MDGRTNAARHTVTGLSIGSGPTTAGVGPLLKKMMMARGWQRPLDITVKRGCHGSFQSGGVVIVLDDTENNQLVLKAY